MNEICSLCGPPPCFCGDPFSIKASGWWDGWESVDHPDYVFWVRRTDPETGETDEIRGNTVPEWLDRSILQARQTLRHFNTEGVVVEVNLEQPSYERIANRSVTLARDGVGIISYGKGVLAWNREQAILAAKSILEYYGE